jgi:ubiquinone/menaquinone biosynthesis C-methylase UbiE
MQKMMNLFDEWPEGYEQWFKTPIGSLVKKYELELILGLLEPSPMEKILDAGCGTGIFTSDILSCGANVTGLDISLPMVKRAKSEQQASFQVLQGDILHLPFRDCFFDKIVSITALEFIEDGKRALGELLRVARRGGTIVVATLNSLSPWAVQRREKAKAGHPLFSKAIFRSPAGLASLVPRQGIIQTAVHFTKDENPHRAVEIEIEGQKKNLDNGAFLAARWEKP